MMVLCGVWVEKKCFCHSMNYQVNYYLKRIKCSWGTSNEKTMKHFLYASRPRSQLLSTWTTHLRQHHDSSFGSIHTPCQIGPCNFCGCIGNLIHQIWQMAFMCFFHNYKLLFSHANSRMIMHITQMASTPK
jgi:hypothetical protein